MKTDESDVDRQRVKKLTSLNVQLLTLSFPLTCENLNIHESSRCWDYLSNEKKVEALIGQTGSF